jgi:hypothetical protein
VNPSSEASQNDITPTTLDRLPGIDATYAVGRFKTPVKVLSWTSAGEPVVTDASGRCWVSAIERVTLHQRRTAA